MAAPPAAVQDLSRTAGLLAHSVSPTPPSQAYEKPSGEKCVDTPLTVAGAATDRRQSLPCSLFTLGRNRGTVRDLSPSFGRGCQMGRRAIRCTAGSTLRASLRAPVEARLQTAPKDRPGLRRADLRAMEGASLEARRTFATPTTLSSWLLRRWRAGSGRSSQPPP